MVSSKAESVYELSSAVMYFGIAVELKKWWNVYTFECVSYSLFKKRLQNHIMPHFSHNIKISKRSTSQVSKYDIK